MIFALLLTLYLVRDAGSLLCNGTLGIGDSRSDLDSPVEHDIDDDVLVNRFSLGGRTLATAGLSPGRRRVDLGESGGFIFIYEGVNIAAGFAPGNIDSNTGPSSKSVGIGVSTSLYYQVWLEMGKMLENARSVELSRLEGNETRSSNCPWADALFYIWDGTGSIVVDGVRTAGCQKNSQMRIIKAQNSVSVTGEWNLTAKWRCVYCIRFGEGNNLITFIRSLGPNRPVSLYSSLGACSRSSWVGEDEDPLCENLVCTMRPKNLTTYQVNHCESARSAWEVQKLVCKRLDNCHLEDSCGLDCYPRDASDGLHGSPSVKSCLRGLRVPCPGLESMVMRPRSRTLAEIRERVFGSRIETGSTTRTKRETTPQTPRPEVKNQSDGSFGSPRLTEADRSIEVGTLVLDVLMFSIIVSSLVWKLYRRMEKKGEKKEETELDNDAFMREIDSSIASPEPSAPPYLY